MTTVHQLVPVLVPGDAISGHVLRVQDALRAVGLTGDVVAEVVHRRLAQHAVHFADVNDELSADLFIYHASTMSPMADWLWDRRPRFLVNYHNITPARYFAPWDKDAATSMRRARHQLKMIAPRARAGLADSAYNAAELMDFGFRDVSVTPLLLPELDDVEPDAKMTEQMQGLHAGTHWLFVGRIAPNKCQHDVIAAFASYRRLFDAQSHLTLVGSSACPSYHGWLLDLIHRLDLGSAITVWNEINDAELVAIYQSSDVFVCLSEHEGFGVPLVEAMQTGTPVVAVARAAIPATVGRGGVLLAEKDPLTVATAVHELMTDMALRESVGIAARARLSELAAEDGRTWVSAIASVLEEAVPAGP
jgi:glycosyltransferase involved in cell wall biosynthesis